MITQYKKGVLDLLVLSMLEKKVQYQYDHFYALNQKTSSASGTIYPIWK
ncbi:MAG: hypothetical protein ABH890_04495 [Bacillota bacterium]